MLWSATRSLSHPHAWCLEHLADDRMVVAHVSKAPAGLLARPISMSNHVALFELGKQVKPRWGTCSLGKASISLLTMQSLLKLPACNGVEPCLSVDLELVASYKKFKRKDASVGVHVHRDLTCPCSMCSQPLKSYVLEQWSLWGTSFQQSHSCVSECSIVLVKQKWLCGSHSRYLQQLCACWCVGE